MKNSSDNTCNLHLYFIYPHITHKKFALKKRLLKVSLNGGVDVARFELLVSSFIKNLRDTNTDKICSLIELLGRFA